MSFVPNASAIAFKEMQKISPILSKKYSLVIDFLSLNPAAASSLRGKGAPPIGSVDYIQRQAVGFSEGRKPKAPQPPKTIPDEMVSVILNEYFKVHTNDIARVKLEHQLAMGSENMVGELLERYLASVLETHGWIWCSGAMVKAIDFLKPPSTPEEGWRTLQVKNRDNSENSSSSAIRIGTKIEKWHRTFSKKSGSNWQAFPDLNMRALLSEAEFERYVRLYLKKLT
jgi:hypothetical protein